MWVPNVPPPPLGFVVSIACLHVPVWECCSLAPDELCHLGCFRWRTLACNHQSRFNRVHLRGKGTHLQRLCETATSPYKIHHQYFFCTANNVAPVPKRCRVVYKRAIAFTGGRDLKSALHCTHSCNFYHLWSYSIS